MDEGGVDDDVRPITSGKPSESVVYSDEELVIPGGFYDNGSAEYTTSLSDPSVCC